MLVYRRLCYGILHTLQLLGQRQLGNPAVEILKAPRHPIPKSWGTIFSPDVALIFCFERKRVKITTLKWVEWNFTYSTYITTLLVYNSFHSLSMVSKWNSMLFLKSPERWTWVPTWAGVARCNIVARVKGGWGRETSLFGCCGIGFCLLNYKETHGKHGDLTCFNIR